MKRKAPCSLVRGAMLALTALALSGCLVTHNTLENAPAWTEYHYIHSRLPPVDDSLHIHKSKRQQLLDLQYEKVICLADYTNRAAVDAELARLEAEGTIQRFHHKGHPAYYALVPFTVVADAALLPAYIVCAILHIEL